MAIMVVVFSAVVNDLAVCWSHSCAVTAHVRCSWFGLLHQVLTSTSSSTYIYTFCSLYAAATDVLAEKRLWSHRAR